MANPILFVLTLWLIIRWLVFFHDKCCWNGDEVFPAELPIKKRLPLELVFGGPFAMVLCVLCFAAMWLRSKILGD